MEIDVSPEVGLARMTKRIQPLESKCQGEGEHYLILHANDYIHESKVRVIEES